MSVEASEPNSENRTGIEVWLWPRFLLFPFLAIAAYPLFIIHVGGDHWTVQTLWIIFLTYCWFCVGGAFHETIHQTLFKNASVNLWYGRILGWMIGIPYTAYRETHRRHHAYLNTPEDYELWPYSDPTTSLTFRRTFVWVDLVFGVFTAPHIYGRIFFTNDKRLPRKVWWTIFYEYMGQLLYWCLTGFGLYLLLRKSDGTFRAFDPIWLLPLIFSPMVNTGRKFVEHLGMTSLDPVLGTRTIVNKGFIGRWLAFFNFDIAIHGPHHRYPKARHYELKTKLHEYRTANPELSVPLYDSYLSAFLDVSKSLWKAPQTGTHQSKVEKTEIVEEYDASDWDRKSKST